MRTALLPFLLCTLFAACGRKEPPLEPAPPDPGYPPATSDAPTDGADTGDGSKARRQEDPVHGLSFDAPEGWRVDPGVGFPLFQLWADPAGPMGGAADGGYPGHISVTVFGLEGESLDGYLASMRETTPEAKPGFEEIDHGERTIGAGEHRREARFLRYSLPWTEGRVLEEATIARVGDQFLVVVGSWKDADADTLRPRYEAVLKSITWDPPGADASNR